MSLLNQLNDALDKASSDGSLQLGGALAEAERLADEFASVRPQTYVVPIEKFVGLPMHGESGNSYFAYSVYRDRCQSTLGGTNERDSL